MLPNPAKCPHFFCERFPEFRELSPKIALPALLKDFLPLSLSPPCPPSHDAKTPISGGIFAAAIILTSHNLRYATETKRNPRLRADTVNYNQTCADFLRLQKIHVMFTGSTSGREN